MTNLDAGHGAFGGDPFIEAEVRRLAGKWGVRTIVETGTYRGETTRALASMGAEVVATIEIKPLLEGMVRMANVRQFIGDSGELMGDLAPVLCGPMLFYLDAHWGPHSPLLEELAGIAGAGLKEGPVIVIHDFFNPLRPEYGFDTWDIGPYRLELIEEALDEIYGAGRWLHRYNVQAAGMKRGVIYIEPVSRGVEVACLKNKSAS